MASTATGGECLTISGTLRRASRFLYFLRTGYKVDGERVIPDFPDENFRNHLMVYQFAAQFTAGKDVLDVGCGTGYGTALLAKEARSAVGVPTSLPLRSSGHGNATQPFAISKWTCSTWILLTIPSISLSRVRISSTCAIRLVTSAK